MGVSTIYALKVSENLDTVGPGRYALGKDSIGYSDLPGFRCGTCYTYTRI